MNKTILTAALCLSLGSASVALACNGEKSAAVTAMSIDDAKKAKPTFVDVNGKDVRAKYGVIPGAVLLTSHDTFQSKELPKDKAEKLVFYCANEYCGASKVAAAKAQKDGYMNVAVLPAGIMGWKDSGQKTQVPRS